MILIISFFGVLCNLLVTPVFSARILGIVPTPSYSHQIAFQPLWRELSLRGHQLTVLTTDPVKNPLLTNLTEIDLHESYKTWNMMNINELAEKSIFELMDAGTTVGYKLVDEQLQHPEVQALLKNETEHFDLVMVEGLFMAMIAFSERFKCPTIQILSLDGQTQHYHAVGNPSHPVLNPDFILPFAGKLTFVERVTTIILTVVLKYCENMWTLPSQQIAIKKHFGNDYPLIQHMVEKTSMMFVNTNPIFHTVRASLPMIVQFGGGTHLKPPQPLPKDLQKILDSASQGCIYFSLGSNVKSKELSEKTRHILLETFAELPYTILWKFEQEDLPWKPNNVIISKWFPQHDILRHPNIKLFITQGGLQSIEEAIYSHVPLIGMPFLFDQPANVKQMVLKGLGLSLDYNTIDKTSFKDTILEVITNPIYRNKVKELSEIARDQPMTGLERAIWWTEYVIRHKGAQHLRSPAIDLPLYQYYLLDVIGVSLLTLLILVYLLKKLLQFVSRIVRPSNTAKKVKFQ